ncbi:MAG: homogentisate 1,2-dioxygenase [Myxococcales bacterium]|nr:MAG: homogentisate 1,2-dioxygenase [Myxococcales bacterium]
MIERILAGEVPKKHHLAFKSPEGKLYYEECYTRQGFDGPYTILYHVHRPQTQRRIKLDAQGWQLPKADQDQTLAKRHFQSSKLTSGGAPQNARIPLLFNRDVVISVARPNVDDELYFVNADGDDLFFIHQGGGTLRTALGDLAFQKNDYLYVPKGMLHRFSLDSKEEQHWLSIECLGGMNIPKQWRNENGQLRMDAPFCHRDFKSPQFRGPQDEKIRDVLVKNAGAFHGLRYEHTPLDVVGWDGSIYPFVFPILNFQPRAGLVHLPPTWHGTFATRGALICSFVPRQLDFHPEALTCPYPHHSVDCDEVLFYCSGEFSSRKGINAGSISYHPKGIVHGPHPGAYESSIGVKETKELAVMLDTFETLNSTPAASIIEDQSYHESFI